MSTWKKVNDAGRATVGPLMGHIKGHGPNVKPQKSFSLAYFLLSFCFLFCARVLSHFVVLNGHSRDQTEGVAYKAPSGNCSVSGS